MQQNTYRGFGRVKEKVMRQTAQQIHEDNRQWLGQIMRKYRNQQYISQSELAEILGYNQAVISRLENGRANPTYFTLMKMARLIGKRIDFV